MPDTVGGYDLAVVGAGPAGLAAAVAAGERGLRVALVDAGAQLGGQYWRHPDENLADTTEHHGGHLWRRFTDLRARLVALERTARVTRVAGHQVWLAEPSAARFRLHLSPTVPARTAHATRLVEAAALVLAPGGYDRHLPVPGWDLPGVMAAGGVQALLKAHATVAGRRAVVAGTGPFLLPVAVGLAQAGATVVAVCEANAPTGWVRSPLGAAAVPSKLGEALGYAAALARHRIPYRTRTVVTAVRGDTEVRGVALGRLDRRGRLRPGAALADLDVDLVAFGWGFTPALELVTALGAGTRVDLDDSLVAVVDEQQRSTVDGVYVAGEATGVGGALLALMEGELAGRTAADDRLATAPSRRTSVLQRRITRARRFAAAMHRAHPVPAGWQQWLRSDTTVCRCEEVTVAGVREAQDALGAQDMRTVKLFARAGMGWCQGRVCGYATAKLAAGPDRQLTTADLAPLAKRTLAAPVLLGELARDDVDQRADPAGAP